MAAAGPGPVQAISQALRLAQIKARPANLGPCRRYPGKKKLYRALPDYSESRQICGGRFAEPNYSGHLLKDNILLGGNGLFTYRQEVAAVPPTSRFALLPYSAYFAAQRSSAMENARLITENARGLGAADRNNSRRYVGVIKQLARRPSRRSSDAIPRQGANAFCGRRTHAAPWNSMDGEAFSQRRSPCTGASDKIRRNAAAWAIGRPTSRPGGSGRCLRAGVLHKIAGTRSQIDHVRVSEPRRRSMEIRTVAVSCHCGGDDANCLG